MSLQQGSWEHFCLVENCQTTYGCSWRNWCKHDVNLFRFFLHRGLWLSSIWRQMIIFINDAALYWFKIIFLLLFCINHLFCHSKLSCLDLFLAVVTYFLLVVVNFNILNPHPLRHLSWCTTPCLLPFVHSLFSLRHFLKPFLLTFGFSWVPLIIRRIKLSQHTRLTLAFLLRLSGLSLFLLFFLNFSEDINAVIKAYFQLFFKLLKLLVI